MKKRTLLLLISGFVAVSVLLFSAFYDEAKKTAVQKLNEEQMIHAKQAARGIEEFFRTWTGILTSLAGMDDIIDNRTDGKRYMGLFYEAHQEQIILNLLNNAIKFTEKGHASISCRIEDNHYILSISDTGIGMRPEEIPNIFQPFHQIDTGLTRKYEGTGLGLSICKKLLDIMGGNIHVESQWGGGSIFTIRFPSNPGALP